MNSGKALATIALVVFVFPIAAIADNTTSTTWMNSGATASASTTFSLNSTITTAQLSNQPPMTGTDLGTLRLTTGALLSGNLTQGCQASGGGCSFSFVGSSFTITGANGGPSFSGKFGSDVLLSGLCVNGICHYTVTGVSGGGVKLTNLSGQQVGTTSLSFTTKGLFTGGKTTALSGIGLTSVSVPEPGTLGLFGIGLFSLASVLRRKLDRT
jgi:PEP-CTERM motif